MFDIKEFLYKHGGHRSKQLTSADEIALPTCLWCGKGGDHFNYNIKLKKGGCLKCGLGVKTHEGIVALLEGITRQDALHFINFSGGDRISAVIDILKSVKEEVQEESIVNHTNADLPKEFELMVDVLKPLSQQINIPIPFAERKYSVDLIEKMQIGFCREGDYACRIIFPIRCNGMKSFVARRIHDWMGKKYKNPPGSKHSQLLYGYDLIPLNQIIFIVEGVTDALRLISYGFYAVCTFGKKLSSEQINLLFSLKPKECVLMFDSDALKEIIKAFGKLSMRINSSVIKLPKNILREDVDPDELSQNEVALLFNKRITMSKIDNTISILSEVV